MKDAYFLILAGGAGERLWPLSSYLKPKQLIPFVNGTSLLEQTLQRIQSMAKNKNHIMVSTNAELQDSIKRVVGKQGVVTTEPVGRNTAPAILLNCLEIYEKNDDAVVVVLPSDHFIPETEKFVGMLWAAISYASCFDNIVLLGIKPTQPATGFGYIQYNAEGFVPGWTCFPVQKFHEKPSKDVAQEYVQRNDMLWNSGIFVARAKVFLDHCQQHAPDVWQAMEAYRKNELSYEQIPSISIDHAVMEKSTQVVVFPATFGWHDVGTLPAFMTLKAAYEKESAAQVINVEATNNIACTTKKVVAFVGVDNLCVVETEESLLVVAQDRVEAVRSVSTAIKGQEKVHAHSTLDSSSEASV